MNDGIDNLANVDFQHAPNEHTANAVMKRNNVTNPIRDNNASLPLNPVRTNATQAQVLEVFRSVLCHYQI